MEVTRKVVKLSVQQVRRARRSWHSTGAPGPLVEREIPIAAVSCWHALILSSSRSLIAGLLNQSVCRSETLDEPQVRSSALADLWRNPTPIIPLPAPIHANSYHDERLKTGIDSRRRPSSLHLDENGMKWLNAMAGTHMSGGKQRWIGRKSA
jgi:hypothetical protein